VAHSEAGITNCSLIWTKPWVPEQVLEPRRLAARAAAVRLAANLGERVGDAVGYRTRVERRVGPNARIEVITTGVLLRRLQRVSSPSKSPGGTGVFPLSGA
jgi:hypothetical protein